MTRLVLALFESPTNTMKPISRHICKRCSVQFNDVSSVCDICGEDTANQTNDTKSVFHELMETESELRSLKTERAELMEQVDNLGKYIGRPGMTAAHIVSETVSLIEKLRTKVSCQNDERTRGANHNQP
jgi:hypothetical protein